MLRGKNILLGVTGSIAAYKAAYLVRTLRSRGAEVRVIMTTAAQQLVSPWTFQSLSGYAVVTDLFPDTSEPVPHIQLVEWADLLCVAPATANIIGKAANGIADDMLSTILLAVRTPLVFAPAMNTNMLDHPAVKENTTRLKARGAVFVEPLEGELACGWEGKGKMSEPETIADVIVSSLVTSASLSGRHILITAGRTEEPLDPVRFLTNHSTGKMGYALAEAAVSRGAEVTLISGPSTLDSPRGVSVLRARTAEEMARLVFDHIEEADVLCMAAAVADYRPKTIAPLKMKKEDSDLTLEFERTRDILAEIGGHKGKAILVGFAMETDHPLDGAKRKLSSKNLDLVVLNDLNEDGAGFAHDTNVVTLIDRSGKSEQLPKMSKLNVADRILDRVERILDTL